MSPKLRQLAHMLGVFLPELRERANHRALIDCAPQLVPLLKGTRTNEARTEAVEKFRRLVAERTDEVLLELLAEGS